MYVAGGDARAVQLVRALADMGATIVQNEAQARRLADRLDGYWKLRSWLYLHVVEVPTLRGVIVHEWDSDAASAVREFACELGVEEVLLRSDGPSESGVYPRGGFNVSIEDLDLVAPQFSDPGRVLFLLEPASPFDDLYSVGIAAWPDEDALLVEVVGPGFDASDLKRGDITPHESLRASRSASNPVITHHRIATLGSYRESWALRLAKVGCLMSRSKGMREALSPDVARRHLLESGHRMLLDHEAGYAPIPDELLMPVVHVASGLGERLRALDLPGEPFMVSMSYIGEQARPVWWDVVWPHLKYTKVSPLSGGRSN